MFLLVNILIWVQQLVLHVQMATIVMHLVNSMLVLQVLFATGVLMVDLFQLIFLYQVNQLPVQLVIIVTKIILFLALLEVIHKGDHWEHLFAHLSLQVLNGSQLHIHL